MTAVVSAPFWRREMGGDPRALGRVLAIGKERYEIVGVAPDGFTGADLSAIDVWLPLRAAMAAESGRPGARNAHVVVDERGDQAEAGRDR